MRPIITVFCVIALSFSVSAWAINDDDALMLYFTFDKDEGGKVTDVSGNNIEGTFEGAVWSKMASLEVPFILKTPESL